MELTEHERTLLIDTIDQAVEGHKESKRLVEQDPVFVDAQEFADTLSMLDDNVDTLLKIKDQLKEVANNGANERRRA